MAVESKIIVTAEDRTHAAFAAIERNTGKTAMAMLKLQGQMLKLAGVGSLVAFFRSGAQSTEKWRDEMARLDEITEKFFNTAADSGRIDPFIKAVKLAYTLAFGASVAIENMGLAIGSLAASAAAAAQLEFSRAKSILDDSSRDMAENEERFRKLREEMNKEAPQGFAKHREDEAERVKNAQAKLKKSEEERLKAILEHASTAEDAIRAEMEISEGLTAPGLTAMGEGAYDEARAKEDELAAEKEAKQRERLTKQIEVMNESFMTEQELLIAQHESRQMVIDDAFMREIVSAEEHARLKEEAELQHQARMGNVSSQGILARRRFQEMNAMQQTQFVLGQMLQLTQGVAANNKTMFQINKIAAIANIALGIPRAVQNALDTYPPPLSFVMAGLQLAASLANMQQAKSAQFGSATSAPSIGGGGATPVFNANRNELAPLSAQVPAAAQTAAPINIIVNLDGQPILETVQRASSDGRLVINAHAVR